MDFDPREEFLMLLACVIEGDCTPFQGQRLAELMREHPEFVSFYREELQTDTLLRWTLDRHAVTRPCVPFVSHPRVRPWAWARKAGAVAAGLVVAGLAVWFGGARRMSSFEAHRTVVSMPVRTSVEVRTREMPDKKKPADQISGAWAAWVLHASEGGRAEQDIAFGRVRERVSASGGMEDEGVSMFGVSRAAAGARPGDSSDGSMASMGETERVLRSLAVGLASESDGRVKETASGETVLAASSVSEPVSLYVAPQLNRDWSTVFTNEVALSWEWPEDAVSAVLEITGMSASVVTNIARPTTHWLWRVFAGEVPSADDVYELSLTFCGAERAAVARQTARLAVLRGAFGAATLDMGENDRTWIRMRASAVVPYDGAWFGERTGLEEGMLVVEKDTGLLQTNCLTDVSGYWGWNMRTGRWGYGLFELELSFPGTVTNAWATVTRLPDGTVVSLK